MKTTIKAVDLYCGAGGSSTGLYQAARELGCQVDLVAINHWKAAIATHSANHPDARHMETSVNSVDPRAVVPGGRLDLLWASPECIFFSQARGGKPVRPQSRASGWHILHWAETLLIDNIIIENVKEYRSWGPLKRVLRHNKKTGKNERVWIPDPKRRGETYQAFLAALRSLNYSVDERILNAADYGDPTTRERLFIIARRAQRKIRWPEASHTGSNNGRLFGTRKKWRAAREIIDWSIPGHSIFHRKRPLAPATLARILSGLEKFGGKQLQPFLVVLRNHGDAQSVERPVPTLCASGNHVGVAQPFILGHRQFDQDCVDSIERPLRTITAKGGADMALVEPFVIGAGGPSRAGSPKSINRPLSTVLTRESKALVEPFLLQLTHGGRVYDVNQPLPTVTTARRGETGVVSPLIAKYYGTGQCRPVTEPLDTITSKDRFGLVMPVVDGYALDIRFRMLQPKELAAAMGFESNYAFIGSREAVVRQIGNAVAVNTAQALCEAVLS